MNIEFSDGAKIEDLINIDLEGIDQKDETQKSKDYSSFDNYSKKRVVLIGYLPGIKLEKLSIIPFSQKYLDEIINNEDINIIRSLCILRLNFLFNYDKIYREKETNGPFSQLQKMDKWFDLEAYNYLKQRNIEAFEPCVEINEFTKHIANINQLIEDNIESIHKYIPE